MSDINQKYFSGLLDVLTQSGIQPRNTKEARKAYSENFQIIDTWHHGTVTIESAVKVLMASKTIAVDVTLLSQSIRIRTRPRRPTIIS